MKHQDGYFKNQENQSIFFQSWLPDNPAKAVLLIVHGLNEHSGRYDHFSDFFVNEGFAVYGMDLIGHGKSDGTRSYVKDFTNYINDLILYLEKIKQLQPGSPIFLIGHSMGGLIGTLFLIDHPGQVAGAVLSGPVVQIPDDVTPLFIALGKFVSFVFPKLGLLKIDLSGLSRNPDVVQAYKDDPLVNSGKFTARVSAEMTRSFDRVADEGSDSSAHHGSARHSDDGDTGERGRFEKLSQENSAVRVSYDLKNRRAETVTSGTYETTVSAIRVPRDFALLQNYPNPFNGETMIRFQLPASERVKLYVYNIRGQRVATIIDEQMEAGYHRISWNGRNDNGRQVGSGVYIYLLQAGRHHQSKKLTYMK